MTHRKKILIAEDEDNNYALIKLIFEKEGFEVIRARDGKEAIELVNSSPDIKIVLMDIKMPIMNGLEATKEIKKINSELPVVAVTAYAMREDRSICINAGCDDIIIKPINRQLLLSTTLNLIK